MKKLILMGRVAAGKTTLTQALKGEQIHYCKTQYINYYDTIIDTPGEYTEVHTLGAALAIYSYEADVIGIVISANEPFCVFPPACTAMVNREVIGIVTGIDKPDANVPQVTRWLKLCGCETIFYISAYTGEGLEDIIAYLREEGDVPIRPGTLTHAGGRIVQNQDGTETVIPEGGTETIVLPQGND